MKHFFRITCVAAVLTASVFTLSAFLAKKKAKVTPLDSYSLLLEDKCDVAGNCEQWTWSVSNPNPGDGDNGTLQDVSHVAISLTPEAEAALLSAEYSTDGVTWISCATTVDRDPSIKFCTNSDVLKFDVGTTGTAPTYFRATFSQHFDVNPYATSWIKTGGGRTGCNMYYFAGMSSPRFD